ncbi:MAG: hypothetical protein AB1779_07230 [Candidatus Thermoplasmatota archaeon]
MNEPKGLMKVVYEHDGKIRALRGEVTLREDGFVEIKTKKRSVLIKKSSVQQMANIPPDAPNSEAK